MSPSGQHGSTLLIHLWMLLTPLGQASVMMFAHVLTMRLRDDKVLRPVIVLDPVYVVHTLLWPKVAPQLLFCDDAMLKDITITVGRRMLGHVEVDIAAGVSPAAAFPVRVVRATQLALGVVLAIPEMVTSAITTARPGPGHDRRHPAATAHAQPGRVGRFDIFAQLSMLSLSFRGTRVVASPEAPSRLHGLAATTSA